MEMFFTICIYTFVSSFFFLFYHSLDIEPISDNEANKHRISVNEESKLKKKEQSILTFDETNKKKR
jgi:hypothetical protein